MKINSILQTAKAENHFKNNLMSSPVAYPKDKCAFGSGRSELLKRNYEQDKELYIQKLAANPTVAFLYNPDLPLKVRVAMAEAEPNLHNEPSLTKKLGLSSYYIVDKWLREGNFDYDLIPRTPISRAYIDVNVDKNAEFLNAVCEKLPHCQDFDTLLFNFNMSKNHAAKLLKSGELKPLEANYIEGETFDAFLFDIQDEQNAQTLEKHTKLHPTPSKKYYKYPVKNGKTTPILVPVTYLSKLGFAPAKKLASMVKNGTLAGEYEIIQTAQGPRIKAFVDIRSYTDGEEKLLKLRSINKNTMTTSDFARMLGIKKVNIDEALGNGELEIISEYIFPSDSNKVFVDLTDEKTKDFMEQKIFESRILKAQRQEEAKAKRQERIRLNSPLQSLRMEIIWSMCPKTKNIASQEAQKDGYLCSIIAKEEAEEELSEKEEITLNSYRKSFWAIAGTEEFKAAQQKAKEYMEIYKAQGIEGIDDPQIRAIFENFEKGQE